MECPFCLADTLLDLGRGSSVSKRYKRVRTISGGVETSEWSHVYLTTKYLCEVCGLVHERMDETAINELIRNTEYEV